MKDVTKLTTYETHTGGEPARILKYKQRWFNRLTMIEKGIYFKKNLDNLRTALMFEPRGHKDMFGVVITSPENLSSAYGLLFMDCKGYLNCCIHGTIASVNVAKAMSILPRDCVDFYVDTISGTLRVKRNISNNDVSVHGVAAYPIIENVDIELFGETDIRLDIAYGGNITACVDTSQFGFAIDSNKILYLKEAGISIKKLVSEMLKFELSYLNLKDIDLVLFYSSISKCHYKTLTIFGDGQFDRSPCGTGSSALRAVLLKKKSIEKNDALVTEGCIGSKFSVSCDNKDMQEFKSHIHPVVTGCSYITGKSQWNIDSLDPYKNGFKL